MIRTRLPLALLLWLAVVAVVASATWLVIDQAGRSVGSPLPPAVALTSSSPPTATPPSEVDATGGATATATAQTPTDPTPSVEPDEGVSAAGSTKTFARTGGSVRVTCIGDELQVEAIRPRDGYRIERSTDDGGLEVTFIRGDSKDELRIRCRSGVPELSADDD